LVWLEASVRGVKAIGYEAQAADIDLVRREREARQTNRIEVALPMSPTGPVNGEQAILARRRPKSRPRGLEAVLVAKRVPERQRHAVMASG
jgi:hypothetical protein